MIPWLLRRLLSAAAAFLGITFVTFGLFHLLPSDPSVAFSSDPSDSRFAPSAGALAEIRRLYGLHLPPLINVSPADRRSVVADALREAVLAADRAAAGLQGERASVLTALLGRRAVERDPFLPDAEIVALAAGREGLLLERFRADADAALGALAGLCRLGGLAVREAAPRLPGMPETRGRRAATSALAVLLGLPADSTPEAVAAGAAATADTRSAAAAAAAAERYRRAGSPVARRALEPEIRHLGALLVPELMPDLLGAGDSGLRADIATLLREHGGADVTFRSPAPRADGTLSPEALSELRRQEREIAAWWRDNAPVFTEIRGARRVLHAVTETRYARWLSRILRFDFGDSMSADRRPVSGILAERLPPTLLLQSLALLVIYVLALPLGVAWARRAGTWRDRIAGLVSSLGFALPDFCAATAAILCLASERGIAIFPLTGLHDPGIRSAWEAGRAGFTTYALDTAFHLVLPVACLSYAGVATLSRMTRASMLEVLGQNFILAARARGLPERRVLWRHGFRNGVIAPLVLLGAMLPQLVGGAVVVESVFGIRGMGDLAFQAAFERNVPVAMAIITLVAVLTLVGYALSDVLGAWLDPRARRA